VNRRVGSRDLSHTPACLPLCGRLNAFGAMNAARAQRVAKDSDHLVHGAAPALAFDGMNAPLRLMLMQCGEKRKKSQQCGRLSVIDAVRRARPLWLAFQLWLQTRQPSARTRLAWRVP